jgi:putative transcriptional regulator
VIPNHHLPEGLVLAYAAGALTEGLALFVATHLTLCPSCRATSEMGDRIGGALMAAGGAVDVPEGLLTGLLDRLDDEDRETPVIRGAEASSARLPHPLQGYTGPLDDIAWVQTTSTIRTHALPIAHGAMPVRLFQLLPGTTIPQHSHAGLERGLVLTGGFTDDEGHFVRGDVSIRDGSRDHLAAIDEGEPCTVLFVNDARLVPRTMAARLAGWWIEL